MSTITSPPEQRAPAPTMIRAAEVRPSSYRAEDNSIEIAWTTGAAGTRFDWMDGEYYIEELSLEPGAVRLGRLNAGACLLDSHQDYSLRSVLGSVVLDSARIEGGEGLARVRLATTPDVADTNQKIIDGHIRSVSVGYMVHTYLRTETEGEKPHLLAIDWEPVELSMVAVPFDAGAQVRARSAEQGGTHPCIIRGTAAASQENEMPDPVIEPAANPAPAAPAPAPAAVETPVVEQRSGPVVSTKTIRERCARSADLGSDFAMELVERNEAKPLSEAEFERAISDRLIEKRSTPHIDVRAGKSLTESDGYRRAIETAVILRADPSVKVEAVEAEAAREFRGMTLMELARDYLQRTGARVPANRLEIAGEALGLRYGAMTTSDFANALSSATARRVRDAYAAAPQTFAPIVSRGTLPDFKDTSIIGLGDAPSLLLVRENAEFTYGAMSDTGQTYKLQTYGRIIAITRQAIINDDKRLFSRIPAAFGRKAADLESDLVWGIITGNVAMSDGYSLFSSQHNNLAGSGGAISVSTVGAGRQAMRSQTNSDGNLSPARPAYLIVGPAKETEAQQFLTAVTPAQTTNVNPFPGTLQLIVEDRITGNQWFLAADPAATDTIELSHLEGQEGLYTETQPGFDVDGVKTKARLDVGAAAIDFRGLYKNPGA